MIEFKKKTILFITNYKLKKIKQLLPKNKKFILKYFNCNNKKHIKKLEKYLKKNISENNILLSFSNSYIFKKKQLIHFRDNHRVNFHPGPPNYPGRDVSHFACYNCEKKFGGTLHSISQKIDNGKIIKVKKFKIKKKKPDHNYFSYIGHKSICILLKENFEKILNSKILFTREKWSKKIYTRKKFLKMLCVKKNITSEKLEHLKKSFYTINYKSLYQISNNKKKFIKFN